MLDSNNSSKPIDIEKELQAARKKLLDLTMRNRLLNFRPSRVKTIRVVDEDPSSIYDILVLQEKSMQFLKIAGAPGQVRKTDDGQPEPSPEGQGGETEPIEDASTLWELPPPAEIPTHLKDTALQTTLEDDSLQQRLFYIYQDSKSIMEELGYSTLYIATTFLQWTEANGPQETRLAPLILIPVEIERAGVRSAFKLKWNGEDISTNISLKEILLQQEIKLPDFEMPESQDGINEYLQKVTDSIKSRPNWHILNDTYLGFFSFTKFIMYKDIDPAAWPEGKSPVEHPLIKAIFGSSGDSVADSGFKEDEVDEKLRAINLYHVLDADPSQIAVIEDVKAGRNLAVEGPPGTGKSQTIVNTIAELMATGKSILFVSEKMAALEVVKNRLDNVGLGDFCLELHSRKSNKKEFLANLEHALNGPTARPVSTGNEYDELEGLKQALDKYAEDLRKPYGEVQLSPYALFHHKEDARCFFEKRQKSIPRVKLGNISKCSSRDYDEARRQLKELQGILPLVAPIATHPWSGCSPAVILPAHEETIKELLEKGIEKSGVLQESINKAVEVCGIRPPGSLAELPRTVEAAIVAANSKPVERQVLLNSEWNKSGQNTENMIARVMEFQKMRDRLLGKFKIDILEQDINPLLEQFKDLSGRFFKFLIPRYRRTKRQILLLYQKPPRISDNEIIVDLEQISRAISLRGILRDYRHLGPVLFGTYWQGENSDPEQLRTFAEWIVYFRKYYVERVFTEKSLDIISKGVNKEEIEKAAGELEQSGKNLETLLQDLAAPIGANYEAVFNKKINSVPLSDILSRLKLWQSELDKLQHWSQYVALRNQCRQTIAAPMLSIIEKDALEAGEALTAFEGNFADDMLSAVFTERPALANFIGVLHEHKIKQFVDLDRKLIMINRQRLVQKLLQERPTFCEGASPGSEIGILRSEFNRKRGHMPIRKLMSLAGGLIQKIKPCFMMSPLSIAQFLDPKTTLFDVIIYDEASQVRPEDALGSLLRGSQVTVIGDTRQLPPTSFFDHLIEDGEEEETAATHMDTESILHQCRSCFPVKMLRWHYRSKHESLVAVSNKEFYDNRLLLYPSPVQESEELGLHLVHLPNTIYDRGAGQTNRMEARIIAEQALEHYRKYPTKSLGIGAFNIKQQQAILEEIELQLRQNPEMEEYFKSDRFEHFFVKNLETIQGDERDVIFISIGYGLDKNGKMTLNFGPLNNEGGERRLNVLITRAREKCIVFSNFKAQDLQVDAGASRGLRALKLFLDFAANHNLGPGASEETMESPFEDSVYDFVKERGYDVKKQVGCAGFRVDLAIVDPKSQGNYLLGIECDGAKYHMSPVARDRDRLRQQILESLNWHICRVWSTDWYRNLKECQQRLIDAIEKRKIENENITEQIARLGHPVSINKVEDKGKQAADTSTDADPPDNAEPKTPPDPVVKYTVSENVLRIRPGLELHEVDSRQLARVVSHVVETEGPVHFEEVVRRIRSFWKLNRTTDKVREAIKEATDLAVNNKVIRKKGDFLWLAKDMPIQVRLRDNDLPPKIEYISDEEIAAAIELVLKKQYATLPDELAVQASRLLGFKGASDKAAVKISEIVNRLIAEKRLQKMANGKIDFRN